MLTVSEIASRLLVSEGTVLNMIRRGDLVAIQVGRQFRVEQQEWNRFMAENRTKGAA